MKDYNTVRPLTAFYVSGALTAGVKLARFISPGSFRLSVMKGVCNSGASATYRVVVNGSALATSSSTGTSVVTTAYSTELAAGDVVQIEVVAAGTGADLSVTLGGQLQ